MDRRSFVAHRRSLTFPRTPGMRQAVRVLRGLGASVLAVAVATCNPDRSSGPCAVGSLVFTGQPGSVTAGVPLSPPITVEARDGGNARASCFTGPVTLSLAANPGGGTLSGTTTVDAVGGIATFANVVLNKSAAGYSFTATAGSITSGGSAVFTVNPAPASKLVVTGQPANATAGVSLTPAVQVTARDPFDNNAAFTGDVTLAITPGSGSAGAVLNGSVRVAAVGGVATFTSINITTAGIGYTLTASGTGLTGAVTGAFNIAPAAAAALVFSGQPPTTGAGSAIPVSVTARDAFGNTATTFSSNVSVALGNNPPPGGTLSGTFTRAAVSGVATFSDLRINRVGNGYTLLASSTGLIGDASAAFNIVPGTATQLVFTAQPATAQAGQPLAAPGGVTVTALDSEGNVATGFTGGVTMGITSGTGTAGAQLVNPGPRAAVAGVATFTTLSIGRAGTGYTLTATAGALTSPPSSAFSITTAPAAALFFTTGPVNRTAGEGFVVTVTARDAFGNDATAFVAQMTLAIGTNAGGGTLTGILNRAATAGVVEFTGLSIDKAGVGYTLAASAASLTGATSAAFNIAAAAATQLAFTTPPTTTVSNVAIPDVVVTARDQFGNTATSFAAQVTLAISANPGGGTLAGTAQRAAVSGVATFPGLSIDKAGTGYTLGASAAIVTAATSGAFNITPAAASQLAFTAPPTTTTAGQPITTVTVTARDPAGNTVTAFTSNVNISIGTNPTGGSLGGTLQQAAVAGVATFAGLNIRTAGAGYQLLATSGGLTTPLSSAFTITPDVAAAIVFSAQPGLTRAGQAIQGATGGVKVTAKDQYGNDATGFTSPVGVALTPNTGTLGATLSNGAAVNAVAGIATFANLLIDLVGSGYTLTATTGGLTAAISTAFNISSGPATQLLFTTPPTSAAAGASIPVTVTARDQFGNQATDFVAQVTLAFGANPGSGTLSGNTATASGGVATFAGLSIDKVGTGYTLTASSGSLTVPTSGPFDIGPAAAAALFFTTGPAASTTAGVGFAVTVTARDQFGNTATGFGNQVTVAFGTNAGPGTLSGTLQQTATGGVTTFAGLSIDKVGVGYTLAATSGTLTAATSAGFNITPAAATQLAFTTPPTTTVSNMAIPDVQVTARDPFGNRDSSFVAQVTLAIGANPGGGTLTGTAQRAAVSGVATFPGLSIDKASPGYTLSATSGTLSGATSAAFTITPGAATHLGFTVNPADAIAGAPIPGVTGTITVAVQDAANNTVTTATGDVTLSIGTNPTGASLGGTLQRAVAGGLATFPSVNIQKAGAGYQLLATSGTLITPQPSGAFAITPAPVSALQSTVAAAPGAITASTGGSQSTITVTAKDQFGNVIENVTVSLAVTNSTGGTDVFAPIPAPLTDASGVSTSTYSATRAEQKTIRATIAGNVVVTQTGSVTVGPAAATRLAFTNEPTDALAGATINGGAGGIVVTAFDQFDNIATGLSANVVLGFNSNPAAGTFTGITSVTPAAGVATFSVSLDKVGAYGLQASSAAIAGAPATSASFNISPASANRVRFTNQPVDSRAGNLISGPTGVQVTVQDIFGNAVTGFGGAVTVALAANPGLTILNGTLQVTPTNGVATFNTLTLNKVAAGYSLTVTSPNLTSDISPTFNITPDVPNAGQSTVSTVQTTIEACNPTCSTAGSPASASLITVTLKDQFGHPIAGETVSFAVPTSGGGIDNFTAPALTDAGGMTNATYNATRAEAKVIQATAELVPLTPLNVTVVPAAADEVIYLQPPTGTIVGGKMVPAVTALARDVFDNVITTVGVTITSDVAGSLSGGGPLGPDGAGVVTFSNLRLDAAGPHTLTASAPGVTTPAVAMVNIGASVATRLVFTCNPATRKPAFGGSVGVTALDDAGNVVTSFDEQMATWCGCRSTRDPVHRARFFAR